MSTTTEPTTHAARKPHRCEWCAQRIEVGETYRRYRWFNGGDAGTAKMHPECYADMQNAADAEGGWLEWTPGDYERPAKEEGK